MSTLKKLGLKNIVKLLVLFALPLKLYAQLLPAEGSKLNYRLIGFSVSQIPNGTAYRLEIAQGVYTDISSFTQKIIITKETDKNKVVAKVPSFGKEYTWRVVSSDAASSEKLYHFSTLDIPNVDTGYMRLRILKNAKKYKDAYVLIDGNRVIYDMQGDPVWFLPDNVNDPKEELKDMKVTADGTITFIIGIHPYEISYDGTVLWKAPDKAEISGNNVEGFHHEFTKLSNGHYMVLGSEYACVDLRELKKDKLVVKSTKDILTQDSMWAKYANRTFGTIIEYDQKGNVVWSWKTSAYLNGSDLLYHRRVRDMPDLALHENAFFFDEQEKVIYYSFRKINRVLKIKYPEGIVLNTYGEIYKPGVAESGNGLFCEQHCCRVSHNGDIYLYDNNFCTFNGLSKLVILKQPEQPGGTLEKAWEYNCTIDERRDTMAYVFPVGGSVAELPDNSLFACMGGTYSKVFIVNRKKKILWSALPEVWNKTRNRWDIQYSFHASIVTSEENMEHLIWGEKINEPL